MNNMELAAAIEFASQRSGQTSGQHQIAWAEHLKALLAVQLERARLPTATEKTISFRTPTAFSTADDPLGQKSRGAITPEIFKVFDEGSAT